MTKYAIYARVSTTLDSQAGSYEAQVNDLKARVKVLYPDYQLVNIYGDYGISGTKAERPVFKEMIDDAIAGKFEIIVTKSISRFARNIRLLLNTLQILEDHKVAVVFLEEGIDSRKTTQKFLLTVLGALAEMEVQNTREHIKESFAMKHAAGKMAKPHTIAYGYRRENGETLIDAQQAEVIKQVFSWFVEDGLSRGAIAQKLNDNNVPIPRPRDGHRWHRTTILYMLKNPKYCGRPEETTDDNEKISFEGPAIIDEATYDKAQKLLDEYSRQPRVIKMREMKVNFQPQMYPLSGLCKCAICGGKVTRYQRESKLTTGIYPLEFCDPSRKGTPLWGCLRYSGARQYGSRCETYMISEQYLYEMIIEAISHSFKWRYLNDIGETLGSKRYILNNNSDLTDALDKINIPQYDPNTINFTEIGIPLYEELFSSIENSGESAKYNLEKEKYNKAIKEIDKKIKRAKDLYIDGSSSRGETNAKIKALQKQKDNIIRPKTPNEILVSSEQLSKIKAFFEGKGELNPDGIAEVLRNLFLDREIRRSLVRALVEEIIIGGEPRYKAIIKIRGYDNPIEYRIDQRAPRVRGKNIRYDKVEYIGDCDEIS